MLNVESSFLLIMNNIYLQQKDFGLCFHQGGAFFYFRDLKNIIFLITTYNRVKIVQNIISFTCMYNNNNYARSTHITYTIYDDESFAYIFWDNNRITGTLNPHEIFDIVFSINITCSRSNVPNRYFTLHSR